MGNINKNINSIEATLTYSFISGYLNSYSPCKRVETFLNYNFILRIYAQKYIRKNSDIIFQPSRIIRIFQEVFAELHQILQLLFI